MKIIININKSFEGTIGFSKLLVFLEIDCSDLLKEFDLFLAKGFEALMDCFVQMEENLMVMFVKIIVINIEL